MKNDTFSEMAYWLLFKGLELTLYILVTPKHMLWQKVKIQMKCCGISSASALFAKIKQPTEEEILFFIKEIITCDPSIYTMDHLKFNISN